MSDTIELRARERLLDRIADLMERNPGDSKWWPDAEKLRMVACLLDKRDHDEGIFDHTEVQTDLRRIADTLESSNTLPAGFPSDEAVEAAARAWCEANGHFFDSCAWEDQHLEHARAALQAGIDAHRTPDES